MIASRAAFIIVTLINKIMNKLTLTRRGIQFLN